MIAREAARLNATPGTWHPDLVGVEQKKAFGTVVTLGPDARRATFLDRAAHERVRDAINRKIATDTRPRGERLSGRRLAELAHLSPTTVTNFLSGKTPSLSLGRLVALAVALDTGLDLLLGSTACSALVEEAIADEAVDQPA